MWDNPFNPFKIIPVKGLSSLSNIDDSHNAFKNTNLIIKVEHTLSYDFLTSQKLDLMVFPTVKEKLGFSKSHYSLLNEHACIFMMKRLRLPHGMGGIPFWSVKRFINPFNPYVMMGRVNHLLMKCVGR